MMQQDISSGLLALGLAGEEAQVERLNAYMSLLQKWNQTYNLTALRDPAVMLTHHLMDSLAIIKPLRRICPEAKTALDVGTGAGLPGVVMAIMCPQLSVTCVDAVGKKAAFVNQVALSLGLTNLKAHHARVENMKGCLKLGGFCQRCRGFGSPANRLAGDESPCFATRAGGCGRSGPSVSRGTLAGPWPGCPALYCVDASLDGGLSPSEVFRLCVLFHVKLVLG